MAHPQFNSKQTCEFCYEIFIWNPIKSNGGKYIIGKDNVEKHFRKMFLKKDYFLCSECTKEWNKIRPKNYSYQDYGIAFKKFLKEGYKKTFIFR